MQEDHKNASDALMLVGLLANYNKFEVQNPYETRLQDFIREDAIKTTAITLGCACSKIRDEYVAVQDDRPEGWNLSTTLTFIGLRNFAPDAKTNPLPLTEGEAKLRFDALPTKQAAVLLTIYTFVNANKLFAAALASATEKDQETPFAAFLSATSYLTHHAHRSARCQQYALLSLLSIQVMVEDPVLVRRLYSADSKIDARLCRQRAPFLQLETGARTPALIVLDICIDTLSHNLRKRLDIELYSVAIGIILHIIGHFGRAKTRLKHHWSYIWGSLMSLIKFLTQYSKDLKSSSSLIEAICTPLMKTTAYCLSAGESFLPDPASYDDLFYKLVENHGTLLRFKEAYYDDSSSAKNPSIGVLLSVSTHYHDLLKAQHGKKLHQKPGDVQKVIRDGYESLNMEIDGNDELDSYERWQENKWKAEMKKITRMVSGDVQAYVADK